MLQCPKCKLELFKTAHTYQCENQHSFDIAKRGYVNLLLGNHKNSGDDKAMIRARTTFLSHGYYQPLCSRLIDVIGELKPHALIDAGCGEGFYTNQIRTAMNECSIYGFDLSKFGVDEACKAHAGVTYGVANVFHLPVFDKCADVLLSVFAPFDETECARVSKDQGYFIKVGPGPKHLLDIKNIVYDEVYENENPEELFESFVLVKEEYVEYQIEIKGQNDIWALFQMTPYYWTTPKEGSLRLKKLNDLNTIVQFHIEVYQKKVVYHE